MTERTISLDEIARTIDHSLLRPELTDAEIEEGCKIARDYRVISVCCRPANLPIAVEELRGSGVKVTTTAGFPHGVTTTAAKVAEARDVVVAGAVEVDMVLHIGRLRSGEHDYVERDIRAVAEAVHGGGALLKVILENAYLSDEQKVVGCRLAEAAGADFVKTSTGYASSGATIPDLVLMRKTVSPRVQVKAAGGVSTLDAVLAVIATGTSRIGTRSTRAILDEARRRADAEGRLPFTPDGQLGGGY